MSEKKISVIIPCYKSKKEYMDRLMDSLLHQTIGLENMEIFLIDDGSPDDTFALLKEYEEQYPEQICLIHYEENRKPGYARTLGIQCANGEYVAFADQDDWIEYTMYEEFYDKAKEFSCDVVAGDYVRDEKYKKPQQTEAENSQGIFYDLQMPQLRKQAVLGQIFTGGYWSAIYRREFLVENEITFPSDVMWDDNMFGYMIRFYAKNCYIFEKKVYHWYTNPMSISMSSSIQQVKDRMHVELLKYKEYKKRGFLKLYPDELEYNFFMMFYMNTMHIALTRLENGYYEIYLHLRKILLQLYPNVENNIYLHQRDNTIFDRNIHKGWEEYIDGLSEEWQEYKEWVPAQCIELCWMDTVYKKLTPQELEGWRILYLLMDVGF